MFFKATLRFDLGGTGMSEPLPKLKLTTVDPVDELAPIPISQAKRARGPFAEPIDSIRSTEAAMEHVTLIFEDLKDQIRRETDGHNGPDRAA